LQYFHNSKPGQVVAATRNSRGASSGARLLSAYFLYFPLVALIAFCYAERNHQGLGNQIIEPNYEVGRTIGAIQCRERLGGMLKYYHRQAA
jgi:hypothetical protein